MCCTVGQVTGSDPGFTVDLEGEHVDVKVRKAQNLLWACRRAYGVKWGLGPRVVHWLSFSIIRSSITFASLVW